MRLYFNFNYILQFIILSLVLLLPKYSLVQIPGYAQGVRIEDLTIFVFSMSFIWKTILSGKVKKSVIPHRYSIFLIYITLISLIHSILGVNIRWFFLFRLIEYYFLIILIDGMITDLLVIVRFCKFYIILNSIIALLQYYGFLGGMTSFAYLEAGHGWLISRPLGLTGGPWELATTVSIAVFIIFRFDKPITKHSSFSYVFYLVLSSSIILLCNTRMTIIAFALVIILFMNIRYTIVFILLAALLIPNIVLDSRSVSGNFIDYFNVILNFQNINDMPMVDWSLSNRLPTWFQAINEFIQSTKSILLGIGLKYVYRESMWVNVVTSLGIIGTLLLISLSVKLDKKILLFIFLAGLTLDVLVAFKIFGFLLIYLHATNLYLKTTPQKQDGHISHSQDRKQRCLIRCIE